MARSSSANDPFTRAYLEGMPESLEGTERFAHRERGEATRTLPGETIALQGGR